MDEAKIVFFFLLLCECGYEWGLLLDHTGSWEYPGQQLAGGKEEEVEKKEGGRRREERLF